MKLPGFQVSDRNLQIKVACQNIHLTIHKYSLGVFCSSKLIHSYEKHAICPHSCKSERVLQLYGKAWMQCQGLPWQSSGSPISNVKGTDSIPGWGIKISYAVQNNQKQHKATNIKNTPPPKKRLDAMPSISTPYSLLCSLHFTILLSTFLVLDAIRAMGIVQVYFKNAD